MPGTNRALYKNNKVLLETFSASHKPCIFLSHRSLDKDMVEQIAEFIIGLEIDVYFDKYDQDLQSADKLKNDIATTACIQKGVTGSTHVMCILSPNTISSWWVPYEIGYGENMHKKIFSVKMKDVADIYIPSYLKIRDLLIGSEKISEYLFNIATEYNVLNESSNFHKKYNFGTTNLLYKYF